MSSTMHARPLSRVGAGSRVAVVALGLGVVIAGCGSPPGHVPSGDGGPGVDAWRPPVVCARPEEGCPCDADAPIECYPDADRAEDGARVCHRGSRTCRDGVWSACESIESWVAGGGGPGRASAGLIGGSEECDDCNPTCGRTTDEPDDGDIDPDDGLAYCDPPGGLCLVPMVPPPPPPPAGCDIYLDVTFDATATHEYAITLPGDTDDVSVYPVEDETTAMSELVFVESVVATSCAGCLPGAVGRSCEGCPAGTAVELTITFRNRAILPTDTEQLIELDVITVVDTASTPTEIDRQHVCLRVPPYDAADCADQGYACSSNDQCCTGVCARVPGRSFSECASRTAVCLGTGAACTVAADCCVGGCNAGFCDDDATCADVAATCVADTDCCTGNCTGGVCSSRICLAQNATCTNDGECCSGNCKSNGKCGSGSTCLVIGESCSSGGDCCSTSCVAGSCASLDFCRAAGEPCGADGECCGLSCVGGYCQIISTECLPRYEPCHQNSECCGLRCDPDDDGIERCLPLGGCRTSGPTPSSPFGEVCSGDAQCCSGQCEPDPNGDLRCKRLNTGNTGCAIPAGQLAQDGEQCNNDCQCVSGNCERLAVSTVHSRCQTGGPCRVEGDTCALPEDCCGEICALWPDAVYRCGLPTDDTEVYTMGSFERTWDGLEETRSDGTAGCASNERPDWGTFEWTSTIDTDTEIRFELQTAATLAGLASAPVVSFTQPSATSPVDIGALLVAGGQPNFLRYLRLTVVLISNDGAHTPVIHDFSLEWVCVPTE